MSGFFLFSYQPKPEIFSIGFLTIRWYGLFLALAIFFGLALSFFWAKKYKIFQENFWSLGFYLIVLGIFGARLYHFFCQFDYYQTRLIEFFYFWQGGFGFYGALFLGLIFLFFWTRKNKVFLLGLLDAAAPSLALGEIFIRLGNYFNQEIFAQPNHFFYQIFASFSSFVFLSFFSKILADKIKNSQKFSFGQIFFLYLILSSLVRFPLEFLRFDFQPVIFGLRLGQIVSIILFTTGIAGLVYTRVKKYSLIFIKENDF